jgi:hypothetical protein
MSQGDRDVAVVLAWAGVVYLGARRVPGRAVVLWLAWKAWQR